MSTNHVFLAGLEIKHSSVEVDVPFFRIEDGQSSAMHLKSSPPHLTSSRPIISSSTNTS